MAGQAIHRRLHIACATGCQQFIVLAIGLIPERRRRLGHRTVSHGAPTRNRRRRPRPGSDIRNTRMQACRIYIPVQPPPGPSPTPGESRPSATLSSFQIADSPSPGPGLNKCSTRYRKSTASVSSSTARTTPGPKRRFRSRFPAADARPRAGGPRARDRPPSSTGPGWRREHRLPAGPDRETR